MWGSIWAKGDEMTGFFKGFCAWAAFGLVFSFAAACGIKAPPRPPKKEGSDIAAKVSGSSHLPSRFSLPTP
jgi:hypothetical protein